VLAYLVIVIVMPGLVPGIHVFTCRRIAKTWMAGTSSAKTRFALLQREFDSRAFGVLISLITATNQITYAFGPGVVGLLRDTSGSYALPFYVCIGLELIAAVLIMVRGRGGRPKTTTSSD
jgi:cyanate permease